MKNLKLFTLILCFAFILPVNINASETENMGLVGQTVKYYKTITYYDNSVYDIASGNALNAVYNPIKSETYEISEEEYNNADLDNTFKVTASTTIETTYKTMVTSLSKRSDNYHYMNILSWKNMPAVRSYDIIGLGFLSTVKPKATPSFKLEYCTSSQCKTTTYNVSQTFSNGASATFMLPASEKLIMLTATFSFDVQKNTSNSITKQLAAGDYAHATKTVSVISAARHEVIQDVGIVYDNSTIEEYFDSISSAPVYWNGTW